MLEEARMREKITVYGLETQNLSGTEYITAIHINNTGAITVRVRAIYIDSQFLCDPSDSSLNPDDTYIDPRGTRSILFPIGVVYEPTAKLTVATERGVKSTEYAYRLKEKGEYPPPYETRFYFGPLMLDYDEFYYTECDSEGNFNPSTWKPGWQVEIKTGTIAWNITVKNVDDRGLTINQFSCFTLFPNKSPSNRRAWYLEPPDLSYTQFIASNETVNLIYIWNRAKLWSNSPQSIYSTVCRNKVFLTFFGVLHEHDGTTKPYGQTIPFQAVHCIPPPLSIFADPSVILYPGQTSIITATVNTGGIPVENANVSFVTTLGTLSAPWSLTDAEGIATVILNYSQLPGTATVTAIWQEQSISANVIMNDVPEAYFTESAHTVYTYEGITFNASESLDSDGSIINYSWEFGDGATENGVSVNHAYINDGVYIVNLTVTDDKGAMNSMTATKTVLNRSPNANFTANPTNASVGEMVQFNASTSWDLDGEILNYTWDFGDDNTGEGVYVTHTYDAPGTYTVKLIVKDDDDATDVFQDYITVYLVGG